MKLVFFLEKRAGSGRGSGDQHYTSSPRPFAYESLALSMWSAGVQARHTKTYNGSHSISSFFIQQ
jgi:hypothetical protein